MAARKPPEDRIFNTTGRKHYRRTYSLTEVRIGAVVLVGLAAIAAWVAYKGQHPDPELTADPALTAAKAPAEPAAGAEAVPEGLAPDGWTQGSVSTFDPSNLYVKINGREGYYKSFGFQRLHFVSVVDDAAPERVVDLELFDLGRLENALGAYAGELSDAAKPEVRDGAVQHVDRNAAFLVQGKFYARAIGSEESEAVRAVLVRMQDILRDALEGGALPWSFDLFVQQMGLPLKGVGYQPEGAFSFGFATDVHVGRLDDGETEIFVVAKDGPASAEAMAGQFVEGFQQYGEALPDAPRFVKDRYLGAVSTARHEGALVLGVRGAPSLEAARAAQAALTKAVAALPESVRARMTPAAPPEAAAGYEEAEGESSAPAAAPSPDDEPAAEEASAPSEGDPSFDEPAYDGAPEGEPSYDEPSYDSEPAYE